MTTQARANRGILYVDEVNLLDDGLVDVVLDAAAGGVNTVEREGISIVHPARFIMIGSGNPQVGGGRSRERVFVGGGGGAQGRDGVGNSRAHREEGGGGGAGGGGE